MARIKDKHIRLPGSAAPLLEELREKMKRTTTVGGMIVNPAVKLTDGLVLSWALAISKLSDESEVLTDRPGGIHGEILQSVSAAPGHHGGLY